MEGSTLQGQQAYIVLDRLVVAHTTEWQTRLRDSLSAGYKS